MGRKTSLIDDHDGQPINAPILRSGAKGGTSYTQLVH